MKRIREKITPNHEIEHPLLGKTLLASALNALFLLLGSLLSYFAVCFPILLNTPSTASAKEEIALKKEELSLNLAANLDYQDYEKAIQNFYFVAYPEEIVEIYGKPLYGNISITAIYNIRVLALPEKPTSSNHQTNYFSYVLKEDGTVDVDTIGTIKGNLSERGKNDVEDLFHTAYKVLFSMLPNVDPSYAKAYLLDVRSNQAAILSSFSFSYLVFLVILPQIFKNRANLGQKVLKLGTADRYGYETKRYKPLLKALLGLPLPLLALYFSNAYSITILLLFPYFLDLLYAVMRVRKVPLLEDIVGIDVIDEEKSVVYKDALGKELENSYLLANYEDPDYVGKLSAKETMNLPDEKKPD